MDILIKGMEMPKERKMFVIETDGSVWEQIADTSYFCTGYKAVELPPHGELKDATEMLKDLKNWFCKDCNNYNEIRCRSCNTSDIIDYTEGSRTIVEASE